MSGQYGKNRQWWAVLYNENMREDWKDEISSLVQLPFAYCVHDKGLAIEKDERRKVHTHLILVWPNTTTYKHACEVFSALNAPGKRSFNKIEPVYNARGCYDYLIHDTEECRKKGKYLFDKSERITGNLYDIGDYQQISLTEKNEAFDQLTNLVLKLGIENFADFIEAVRNEFADQQDLMRDVIRGYSGYFDRLIKGVYLRGVSETTKEKLKNAMAAVTDPCEGQDGSRANLKEGLQNAKGWLDV